MPGAFLPTAERSGMIRELDRRMIAWAIELIARCEPESECAYEVNLSARSLIDPDLPGLIAARIDRAGIDPSNLVFEITETAAIANMDQARNFATSSASRLPLRPRRLRRGVRAPSTTSSTCRSTRSRSTATSSRTSTNNPTDQLLVKHMAEIAAASASTRSPSSSRTARRSRCSPSTASTPRRATTSGAPHRSRASRSPNRRHCLSRSRALDCIAPLRQPALKPKSMVMTEPVSFGEEIVPAAWPTPTSSKLRSRMLSR